MRCLLWFDRDGTIDPNNPENGQQVWKLLYLLLNANGERRNSDD